MKDKYIYREFTNQYGKYEENMNVTTIFDSVEDLIKMINKRKQFYKTSWYKRKIEIEVVPEETFD